MLALASVQLQTNCTLTTAARTMSLSEISITADLTVVVVPLTVRLPTIVVSWLTLKFLSMVTSYAASPLIHASVPEPITNCLLPLALVQRLR